MDNGKEFTHVIRPMFIGSSLKYLLASGGDHAAIFKFAGRAIAGRIHANGWKHRLCAGCLPFSVRGGFPFELIILRKERGVRIFAVVKGFVLCANKTLHLFFTVRPSSEDACLTAFPNDVIFLLCHTSILHQSNLLCAE